MKTFFDANVLLETLLIERKKAHIAVTVLSRTQDAAISPLTTHLYVYFGKREKHAVSELLEDLQAYQIAPMDQHVFEWAVTNRQYESFEDALQVACAVLGGYDRFVTFDSQLSKNYRQFIDIQLLA